MSWDFTFSLGKKKKDEVKFLSAEEVENKGKGERKQSGTFEIDPLNPVIQVIGIILGGFLGGWFINSWVRWGIWLIGGCAWAYFTFFKETAHAVKGD